MTKKEAISTLIIIKMLFDNRYAQEALDIAIEALKDRPQGEWIEHEWAEERDGFLTSDYECSNCHDWLLINPDYCSSCGAYMRGKKNEYTSK